MAEAVHRLVKIEIEKQKPQSASQLAVEDVARLVAKLAPATPAQAVVVHAPRIERFVIVRDDVGRMVEVVPVYVGVT